MSNEIDTLSAGELQPFNEGMPVLAPLSPTPDTWGQRSDVDTYQRQPQGPTLFGSPLPAGTSRQQVEQMLGQLSGAFMSDLSSIGYPAHMINAAVQFVNDNALKAPYSVQKNHPFNLHGEDDYLAHGFGNMVQTLSGSPRAKQQFVTACLQWLAKANKQLASQHNVGTPAQGSAPSGRPDDLSNAEYNALYDYNEKMRSKTEGILEQQWGDAYEMNRWMVDEYLQGLPLVEQEHFDRFLNNGLHALNDPTVILGLYNQAIGHGNLPSGAALAAEIAEHEAAMRGPNRKAWMMDERMGARYRELIMRRDGR